MKKVIMLFALLTAPVVSAMNPIHEVLQKTCDRKVSKEERKKFELKQMLEFKQLLANYKDKKELAFHINQLDKNGLAPLILALQLNRMENDKSEFVKLLLEYGAFLSINDVKDLGFMGQNQKSPLEIAASNQHLVELVPLLLENGAVKSLVRDNSDILRNLFGELFSRLNFDCFKPIKLCIYLGHKFAFDDLGDENKKRMKRMLQQVQKLVGNFEKPKNYCTDKELDEFHKIRRKGLNVASHIFDFIESIEQKNTDPDLKLEYL